MDSQPELLAQHCTEAGLVEKGIGYWGKAGHRSISRSAMAEAAAQFQRGLDELALLPEDPERQRQELELLSGLGAALQTLKGSAAPETGQAYARAGILWERLGSPPEFLPIAFGQSVYHMLCGELDLALRLDEELVQRGRQSRDPAGIVLGCLSFGRRWVRLCPGSEQEGPARVAQCPHERRSGARGGACLPTEAKRGWHSAAVF
jgi:predicted ATPase